MENHYRLCSFGSISGPQIRGESITEKLSKSKETSPGDHRTANCPDACIKRSCVPHTRDAIPGRRYKSSFWVCV